MKRKIRVVLKRAGVFVLVSACAFSLNIAEVFAMDNGSDVGAAENVGTAPTENTGSGEAVKPVVPEKPDVQEPETPVQPEQPAEPEKPVVPEEPTEPEEPEAPTEPEKPTEPEEPTEPEIPEVPVEPEVPSTPETPSVPDKPAEPEKPAVPSTPEKPAAPEVTIPAQKAPARQTGSKKGGYTGNTLVSSKLILDKREKVKYNIALPIEGLPSFITQEMVIGALKCQDETGFPASVTIAQIIQESGYGRYGAGGDNGLGLSYLAFQYNNLFGIKGTGTAGSIDMRTGEQTAQGVSYMTSAGFRVYNTYTESIEDRTDLLKRIYGDLIAGAKDADSFAMQIGGRWATDISYGQSLIYQMKKYDLYRLDKLTLKEFSSMIGKFADVCPGSTLTSDFGYREFRNSDHKGIDLGTGLFNIPTYAADAGTVVVAGFSSSAGNWVVIDHGNGVVTKYMHHDRIFVKEGQHVEKGQQIGLSGTTGDSTGNHLHFQVEENGVAVNPAVYLGLL